jgi:Fe-S cluster assembly protein SufB
MSDKKLNELANREYKYGFKTEIESDTFAKGLSEDTIRRISKLKK